MHTVSLGQGPRRGLAGWSELRVSHKVAVKLAARATVIWGSAGATGSASRLHLVGRLLSWLLSRSHQGGLLLEGSLSVLTTWQLAFPRAKDPRKGKMQATACSRT